MGKELQDVQNEYSRMTGISVWVCRSNHERVTERSLAMDFFGDENEDFFEFVDKYVKNFSSQGNTSVISYEGRDFFVRRQALYVGKNVCGYCVSIKLKSYDITIDRFTECSEYFEKLVSMVWGLVLNNDKLSGELKKLQAYEEDVERENRRLKQENDYDELTHVHSRAYFFKKLEEVDADPTALPVSVVVGDVNNLKFTNDMFGHRHGDWLLYKIGQILQETAEDRFTVARCGGDEFYILMPNTKRSEANYYCHLVKERLMQENDTCLPPTISLGAAKKSEMEQSLFRLLETADAKMYAIKSEFKSRQNQFDDMIKILISRGFLDVDCEKKKSDMIVDFAMTLDWSIDIANKCKLLIKYQDVGLTIIPGRVYTKREYNQREWREIKKHPQLAMKLALIRPETAVISNWMYTTHENYDGSGWPKGISGDDILPEVTAVRLVTEFVENEAKYGTAFAVDFIKNNSGKIFEPGLTEKFVEFLEENVVK